MAQEFTLKSNAIEDKINQLLPAQGGFGAGVDFSASTMVIPIVDLTETASGSVLREDLQTAIAAGSATSFSVYNTTTTVLSGNTGFWRVLGTAVTANTSSTVTSEIIINDGASDIVVWQQKLDGSGSKLMSSIAIDFNIFLKAGDSLKVTGSSQGYVAGSVRQIADLSGNLVNPSGFTIT